MILACHNIDKSFGTDVILKQASFHVEEREKAAVVGNNGAGKSTLLKILVQEERADAGEVILAKGKTMGYLAQHQEPSGNRTVYGEMLEEKRPVIEMEQRIRSMEEQMKHMEGEELSGLLDSYTQLNQQFEYANGYAYKSEITGVLKGLGFAREDFDRPLEELSGGQKTRVALGRLLLSKPDVLLLDEPTNHLDMNSIAWLENYLLNYDGAVVIVSHDRYFLNKVVTKVIEIDNGELNVFSGNYTDYAHKKAQLRQARLNHYINQQREIRHQEEVIAKLKQFNREKSIKRAESREKMLDKIEVANKPVETDSRMNLTLEPDILSGNDVLKVRRLSKSFPPKVLFENVDIDIQRGEKVAIIGDNGTGKTTMLKILNRMEKADEGEYELGAKVHIGYYDQEHHVLHPEKTLFEEISDAYPALTSTRIRNVLAAFLFTGDDVFKKIETLSGGERGRLSLAKLMLSEANFLILDEPTNHLDMVSKEILEQALREYTGTVLYVSHDRYFINETATRILELKGHTFINYIGNYDYYIEKNEALTAIYAKESEGGNQNVKTDAVAGNDSRQEWKQHKEQKAARRKLENILKKTEDEIASVEERIEEIDELMTQEEVYTNGVRCRELTQEKKELEEKLENMYTQWEEVAQKLQEDSE